MQKQAINVPICVLPHLKTRFCGLFVCVFLVFVFYSIFSACQPSVAQSSNRLEIDASTNESFARIVLDFTDLSNLPAYEVKADNGVLVITFDEPFSTQLPDIAEKIGDYVSVARLDPDRKGIRMALKKSFGLNTIEAGEKLFVDLLDPDWVGLPPGLPENVLNELVRRAQEAAKIAEQKRKVELARLNVPKVDVSVGRLPTVTRLIFDWTHSAQHTLNREKNRLDIEFDWPADIDLMELERDRPDFILETETGKTDISSTVTFVLKDDVEARSFGEDKRIILDLEYGIDTARAESLDFETLKKLAQSNTNDGLSEIDDLGTLVQTYENQEGGDAEVARSIAPEITRGRDTIRIRFPFNKDTPAAIFERAGQLWMLFDTTAKIEIEPLQQALKQDVSDIRIDTTGATQIVRFRPKKQALVSSQSDETSWIVSMIDQELIPTEQIRLRRRTNEQGLQELHLQGTNIFANHILRDDVVGDILQVATLFPPARGNLERRHFVEFSILPTVHGLVVKPYADDVRVAKIEGQSLITRAQGLTLSDGVTRSAALLLTRRGRGGGLPDLREFEAQSLHDTIVKRDQLMRAVAVSEANQRREQLKNLAAFYIANQFGIEAIGVMNYMIERKFANREPTPDILVLAGAANVLANRPERALELLSEENTNGFLDAVFWRAIAGQQMRDWFSVREAAEITQELAPSYPTPIAAQFLLAAAEAGIELKDASFALRFLRAIDTTLLDQDNRGRHDLLIARTDLLIGHVDDAIEGLVALNDHPHRGLAIEAKFRTIQALHMKGELDMDTALEQLHAMTVVWRGDALEAEMLAMLGNLYFESKSYRDGFDVMKVASQEHKDHIGVRALQDRAKAVFERLFLHGEADTLNPVKALSLYYDFRNLTPIGARGDEMIRNLSRRLIYVDLLDQAAELLTYQVDNRLKGAGRAQVAVDLALVYLADKRPDQALSVLKRTHLSGISETLSRQRQAIEARALIELGRHELALDLLRLASGPDIDQLRIEAHWLGGRYIEAAELLETQSLEVDDEGTLRPHSAQQILRAAVGYTLAGDEINQDRLRGSYAKSMEKTEQWPIFDFVTLRPDITSFEFRAIAREIAAQDSFEAFLDAYNGLYRNADALVERSSMPFNQLPADPSAANTG